MAVGDPLGPLPAADALISAVGRVGSIDDLETALGYRFRDRALLERALTHSSARSELKLAADNERLEFLGDRVLGLAVAELLLERLPEADEGTLARHFNRLVRREACARVARDLQLGDCLRLGEGEAGSGGRAKDTILADACEALLGAMLLDAGFARARRVVRRLWEQRLAQQDDAGAPDAKTALQEWAQGRGLSLPAYVEVSRAGPAHRPRFVSEVRIKGLAPAAGGGENKRAAEQAAARTLLEREGIVRQ